MYGIAKCRAMGTNRGINSGRDSSLPLRHTTLWSCRPAEERGQPDGGALVIRVNLKRALEGGNRALAVTCSCQRFAKYTISQREVGRDFYSVLCHRNRLRELLSQN